jgi:hypothetical protein
MNSIHTANLFEPTSAADLERKINRMEKAGASWEDCAATAIEFFESQNEKSDSKDSRSGPGPADEELTFEDDPNISEHDASGPEQDASTSEPDANRSEGASDPNASQSEQKSEPASDHEPEAEPQLPPPPKFQFGAGNPLYEAALDFRAYRDKRSILDHLTDTQRDAIFQLLDHYSEEKVSDLLAKAPPAGLSIQVSRASLNRFRKRYQKQKRLRNSNNFKLEMDRLLQSTGANDQAFLTASERFLKMRLFEITGDPNSNLETVAKLTAVITTLRKQALAERKTANPKPPPSGSTTKFENPAA